MLYSVLQYNLCSKVHAANKGHENYRLFRFEDLLEDPERIIRNLCDFCRLEYRCEMLAPRSGQASSLTGKPHAGFEKGAARRWEGRLSRFDQAWVSAITAKSRQSIAMLVNNFIAVLLFYFLISVLNTSISELFGYLLFPLPARSAPVSLSLTLVLLLLCSPNCLFSR